MERYIGMDVHAASCTLAVISEKGRKLKDFPVETNGQALVEIRNLDHQTVHIGKRRIPHPRITSHLCRQCMHIDLVRGRALARDQNSRSDSSRASSSMPRSQQVRGAR